MKGKVNPEEMTWFEWASAAGIAYETDGVFEKRLWGYNPDHVRAWQDGVDPSEYRAEVQRHYIRDRMPMEDYSKAKGDVNGEGTEGTDQGKQ